MTRNVPAAEKKRRLELGLIHKGAKALGLIQTGDDSGYRDMLFAIGRVRSARDLDHAGRRRVLEHLQSRGGLRPKPGAPAKRSPPQVRFMRMLWIKIHQAGGTDDGSERAFRSWCRTEALRSGREYDAPELMPGAVRQKLAEQLKEWAQRLRVTW
jgi:phage gp16-like protein